MKLDDSCMLKIEKVAFMIDVSVQTINNWYRFKRECPDNEFAEMLPDYIQEGDRQTRYWNINDIPKLIKFKESIPHGHVGVMGVVTHRKKGEKNGKED